MLPRQFRRLLEALQNAFQQHLASVNADHEANHEDRQRTQKWRNDILVAYQEAEKSRSKIDDRQHSLQKSIRTAAWLTFIATATAAVGAIYYANVARQQRDTMDKTFREAQSQTHLLQQQLEETNGALLSFDQFSPGTGNGIISLNLRNMGRYAAKDVHAEMRVSLVDIPTTKTAYQFPVISKDIPRINPITHWTSDPVNDSTNAFYWLVPYPITAKQKAAFTNGKLAIKAMLSVSYNNGFEVVNDGTCMGSYHLPPIAFVGGPVAEFAPSGIRCEGLEWSIKFDLGRQAEARAKLIESQKKPTSQNH